MLRRRGVPQNQARGHARLSGQGQVHTRRALAAVVADDVPEPVLGVLAVVTLGLLALPVCYAGDAARWPAGGGLTRRGDRGHHSCAPGWGAAVRCC
ncbi:MAG: hypothetical protein JWQ45_2614 [Blastococcus sp.]|jgi:hypothetical protein|nr:hypothetical protein [Blastococcus sp.]